MVKKTHQPASLNVTLKALESALNDWENTLEGSVVKSDVDPDVEAKTREMEVSRQAKKIFLDLKKQIDELSE